MYRCDRCGEVMPPRTPSFRRVVATRSKSYPFRSKANVVRVKGKVCRRDDLGGEGTEIVSEDTVCPDCAGSISGRL